MKLRITIYLLSTLFFLSACQKKETQSIKETVSIGTIDTLTIPIATGLKPSLRLTSEAKEATKDWALYQTFSKRLDSLQSISLGALKNQLSNIIPLFDTQEEAEEASVKLIPNNLDSPAVNARLLTVETKLKVLNNYAQKGNPDAQEITIAVGELKNAFQNLNLQINENFTPSIEDMLKKLNQVPDDPNDPEEEKPTPRGKPPVEIYKTKQ